MTTGPDVGRSLYIRGMDLFHPWRLLRSMPDVTVEWTASDGVRGATDGSVIYMHPELLQVERRCTVTHETIHVERGHHDRCSNAAEWAVRVETARRLITIDALLDTLSWTEDWVEAAEELNVTYDVFKDRVDSLTQDETDALIERDRRNTA